MYKVIAVENLRRTLRRADPLLYDIFINYINEFP